MIEKESLTHRIEDDMERRNRNWDIIKTHLRNYTEQVGNPANLTTVSKEVVGAVNELKDEIDPNKEELTQHKLDYAPQRSQDQLKVATVEKELNDYKNTLAQVNVNHEAKQSASGYGIVSLPPNTANGQVSMSIFGNTETNEEGNTKSTIAAMKIKSVGKNLLRNGNGEEGTKYWDFSGGGKFLINNGFFEIKDVSAFHDGLYSKPFKLQKGIHTIQLYGQVVNASSYGFAVVDINKNVVGTTRWITTGLKYYKHTVNIEQEGYYKLGIITGNTGMTARFKEVLCFAGDISNPIYEPYTESNAYVVAKKDNKIVNLMSHEGVHDEIDLDKRELIKRIGVDEEGLTYQLAQPIEMPVQTSGSLVSYPSGTVYIEPFVADVGIYTDKMEVLYSDLPIKALEKISKIDFDTGLETELDITAAVIAADGLSFTHPQLASGDIVFFTYFHNVESTQAETTIEYYDSRYVFIDTVTGKYYKVVRTIENGVIVDTPVEV